MRPQQYHVNFIDEAAEESSVLFCCAFNVNLWLLARCTSRCLVNAHFLEKFNKLKGNLIGLSVPYFIFVNVHNIFSFLLSEDFLYLAYPLFLI